MDYDEGKHTCRLCKGNIYIIRQSNKGATGRDAAESLLGPVAFTFCVPFPSPNPPIFTSCPGLI